MASTKASFMRKPGSQEKGEPARLRWTLGLCCEGFLEGLRAGVSERRVQTASVVERLDVFEQRRAGVVPIGERGLVDELSFERAEKALDDGVVPAVALAAHAGDSAVVREEAAVVVAGGMHCAGPGEGWR